MANLWREKSLFPAGRAGCPLQAPAACTDGRVLRGSQWDILLMGLPSVNPQNTAGIAAVATVLATRNRNNWNCLSLFLQLCP